MLRRQYSLAGSSDIIILYILHFIAIFVLNLIFENNTRRYFYRSQRFVTIIAFILVFVCIIVGFHCSLFYTITNVKTLVSIALPSHRSHIQTTPPPSKVSMIVSMIVKICEQGSLSVEHLALGEMINVTSNCLFRLFREQT